MTIRLLIVEDDEKIADNLAEAYGREGVEVVIARDGEDGFFRASTEHFDLIVLDVMLPGRDGFQVLAALRKLKKDTPVLILSSRGETDDRVHGLTTGADDYLIKPFALAELIARTQALLRRGRSDTVLRLHLKDLHMDLVTRRAVRGGKPIDLTVMEFDLLEYLLRYARQTVSRDMLARDVWKEVNRATPLDNVIDVHIGRLRKKIDLPQWDRLIHTVRGIGFCLSDKEVDH